MTVITELGIENDTRSIAIFGSYLALCAGLFVLVLSGIRFRNFSKASGSWIFMLLTLASLGTTWFYMIMFFVKSYNDWEVLQAPSLDGEVRLGPWLKDVKLFQEAWGTVIKEPSRWWWSQQIFLATCGWTVFLAAEGSRRRIRNLWAFMLLGQVVAISFVMNLFFLTLLLHDASPALPANPTPKIDAAEKKVMRLPNWLYFVVTIPLAISYLFSFLTPKAIDTNAFLPFLLVPHVLLVLVPFVFERLAAHEALNVHIPANRWKGFWKPQYRLCAFVSVVCHAHAISTIAVSGMTVRDVVMRTFAALYDHPAVSSVGWDVIMVGVSVGMWIGVRGLDFGIQPEKRREGGDWLNAIIGWVYMGLGSVGLNALAFAGELE